MSVEEESLAPMKNSRILFLYISWTERDAYLDGMHQPPWEIWGTVDI